MHSGKSESITINNERGRLSQEEINRMVEEAEMFAEQVRVSLLNWMCGLTWIQDKLSRERVETLNKLSSFVYGLKSQVADEQGLGGKLGDADVKTLKGLVSDTVSWIDEHGASASTEDLEEKFAGELIGFAKARLLMTFAEVQSEVNPITAKLYQSGTQAEEEDEPDWQHVPDEL